jgi:hypothetical protein
MHTNKNTSLIPYRKNILYHISYWVHDLQASDKNSLHEIGQMQNKGKFPDFKSNSAGL